MPLLLLLLSCSPVDEDRCLPGVEIVVTLDEPTDLGQTGWEVLARALAATDATLTWPSGDSTALTMAVEATEAPWVCVADPSRGDMATGTHFVPSWHLPVRWTLRSEDGLLDLALAGELVTSDEDADPWLQGTTADATGVPLGDIDPAVWSDFAVVATAILPESGSTGVVFATGWQDVPDGQDLQLDATLATW